MQYSWRKVKLNNFKLSPGMYPAFLCERSEAGFGKPTGAAHAKTARSGGEEYPSVFVYHKP